MNKNNFKLCKKKKKPQNFHKERSCDQLLLPNRVLEGISVRRQRSYVPVVRFRY